MNAISPEPEPLSAKWCTKAKATPRLIARMSADKRVKRPSTTSAAQSATDAFNALSENPGSSADPAGVFDAYAASIAGIAESAPEALRGDIKRSAAALVALRPILARHAYNANEAFGDPVIAQVLTADVNAGAIRINDYNRTVCGLTTP